MHRLIALRAHFRECFEYDEALDSRLILKISYFIISTSELVLRNKIRFVARVFMLNVDLTVAFLATVS